MGEGKVLKITDLGMSRETDEVYVQKTKGRVPLKWMAVESIITREFTSASDVWAYGVILWEIGTLGKINTSKDYIILDSVCSFILLGIYKPSSSMIVEGDVCSMTIYRRISLPEYSE